MKYIVLFFCLFLFSSWVYGKPKDCAHTSKSFQCVKYLKNYDADTITFDIDGVHPLLGKKIGIRVNGVDTPELRTNDKCEKRLGLIAKEKVGILLKKAKRIDLVDVQRGKYFRIVADVIIDGKSLSEYLLKNKLAYPYDGGAKAKVNWCQWAM